MNTQHNNNSRGTKVSSLSLNKNGVLEQEDHEIPVVPFNLTPINVVPKRNIIVVQPIPDEDYATKGGIIIPASMDPYRDKAIKAVCVRVGEDIVDYETGDVLILNNPQPGTPARISGTVYLFIYESEIVGKYEDFKVKEAQKLLSETDESIQSE